MAVVGNKWGSSCQSHQILPSCQRSNQSSTCRFFAGKDDWPQPGIGNPSLSFGRYVDFRRRDSNQECRLWCGVPSLSKKVVLTFAWLETRVAGQRGQARIYKSELTYKQQSTIRVRIYSTLHFSNQCFQRSRIIEIEEVFATPISISGGPCLFQPRYRVDSSWWACFLKHKQLYRVRIDDHIKQFLNRRYSLRSIEFCILNSKILSQKHVLWKIYKPFALCLAQQVPFAWHWSYH